MGTHVYPWLIHVNVWQNQYSIVKQNKVKIKIKKKKNKAMPPAATWMQLESIRLSEVSQKKDNTVRERGKSASIIWYWKTRKD